MLHYTSPAESSNTSYEPMIYPIREDSQMLLPFADVAAGTSLLEVGCGRGIAALAAARCGAQVVATDLNPYALRRLASIARIEGLDLLAVRTDLASGTGRFDRVLSNPPYLPTPPGARDPDRWHDLALNGGADGCDVTARLIGSFAYHLNPGGSAYLVVSSRQFGPRLELLRAAWIELGGVQKTVARSVLGGEHLEIWELTIPRTRAPSVGDPPPGTG